MSLCTFEPPFVKLEAESGLSGVGLECPLDGDPARSGELSENFCLRSGVRGPPDDARPLAGGVIGAVGTGVCDSLPGRQFGGDFR